MLAVMSLGAFGVGMAQNTAAPDTPLGPQWEFKVVYETQLHTSQQLERALNQLGEQGWELVGTDQGQFIFKRPRS
jgi:hypothetical protein